MSTLVFQERSRLWNAGELGEISESLGDGRDPDVKNPSRRDQLGRERPQEFREAACNRHGLSGSLSDKNWRKSHDFRGVAPFHPFSPSTASRDWERYSKVNSRNRLGVCCCATNIGLNLQQTPLCVCCRVCCRLFRHGRIHSAPFQGLEIDAGEPSGMPEGMTVNLG